MFKHLLQGLEIFVLLLSIGNVHWLQAEHVPFLVLLVDAPHLDCTDNRALCKSIAKHPSSWNKSGNVGHAWIYLHGSKGGKAITIEGGHSGETGQVQAKYFEGIMNYIHFGCANPAAGCPTSSRVEPNPVKYLWEGQKDGFFQKGSGMHRPTYAAMVYLTDVEFRRILAFIDPRHYNYEEYFLSHRQCTTFVAEVAALVGLKLDCQMIMPIGPTVCVFRENYVLWTDPKYSVFSFASPDVLERSLKRAVEEGRALPALSWYRKRFKPSLHERLNVAFEALARFPERLCKYLML